MKKLSNTAKVVLGVTALATTAIGAVVAKKKLQPEYIEEFDDDFDDLFDDEESNNYGEDGGNFEEIK